MLVQESEGRMNMRLRAAREKSGKTQAQVAKESGVSVISYQLYEYGKREPSASIAIQIAKSLDSTVESLFTKKNTTGNQNSQ